MDRREDHAGRGRGRRPPRGRAIVLGFYLTDVKGAEARQTLLKEALSFLRAEARQPAPVIITETRPAMPPVSPAGAGSGELERK